MEEARIKCLVHGSSLRGGKPLVMVTTRSKEEVIRPPRAILNIEDKIEGSRIFTCQVLVQILENKGETFIVRIQSDEKEAEFEVPKDEVVFSV